MSQNISVVKIGELDEIEEKYIKETCVVNFAKISDQVYKIEDHHNKYPWLSSIDPYGTTWINGLQANYIILELDKLKKEIPKVYHEDINNIKNFINTIDGSNINFIKFIGD